MSVMWRMSADREFQTDSKWARDKLWRHMTSRQVTGCCHTQNADDFPIKTAVLLLRRHCMHAYHNTECFDKTFTFVFLYIFKK